MDGEVKAQERREVDRSIPPFQNVKKWLPLEMAVQITNPWLCDHIPYYWVEYTIEPGGEMKSRGAGCQKLMLFTTSAVSPEDDGPKSIAAPQSYELIFRAQAWSHYSYGGDTLIYPKRCGSSLSSKRGFYSVGINEGIFFGLPMGLDTTWEKWRCYLAGRDTGLSPLRNARKVIGESSRTSRGPPQVRNALHASTRNLLAQIFIVVKLIGLGGG